MSKALTDLTICPYDQAWSLRDTDIAPFYKFIYNITGKSNHQRWPSRTWFIEFNCYQNEVTEVSFSFYLNDKYLANFNEKSLIIYVKMKRILSNFWPPMRPFKIVILLIKFIIKSPWCFHMDLRAFKTHKASTAWWKKSLLIKIYLWGMDLSLHLNSWHLKHLSCYSSFSDNLFIHRALIDNLP